MAKIAVAMSGGVDSSVAAALLKQQGHQIFGMFMKNWSPETSQSLPDCPWEQDQADAMAVCQVLGVPFRSINFEKEYREKVVNYFLSEYAAGRTPNPDVICNKEIKFSAFWQVAQEMGAEQMATGHYAQIKEKEGKFQLRRGRDPKKDQSYFLYQLSKEQLAAAIFPLGELTKPEVRKLAQEFQLPTAQKKDSQGICFIGHLDLKKFLGEHLSAQPGETYRLPSWQAGVSFAERKERAILIGKHRGGQFYTIGQRAGHLIDNGLYQKSRGGGDVPLTYILEKEAQPNRLYITDQHADPDFQVKTLYLENFYLTGNQTQPTPLEEVGAYFQNLDSHLICQVRYQPKEMSPVSAIQIENRRVEVRIAPPYLEAVAAGQSLVIYENDQVIGGGIVADLGRVTDSG